MRSRLVALLIAVLVLGAATPLAARGEDEAAPDRYDVAGGCFALGLDGEAATPVRFVATDLARYLLVDPQGRYLGGTGPGWLADPSPRAEWTASQGRGGLRLRAATSEAELVVDRSGDLVHAGRAAVPAGLRLRPATGCWVPPDIATGVTGPHATGSSPIEEVRGFLDSHLHITAFEFLGGKVHCGRPWHPYGVTYALRDCVDHEVGGGNLAVVESFLNDGTPIAKHDPVGWPTFRDWPAPRSLTHEQTYHRWLERAWRGGLRMIVNLFTDNRVLCELYPLKQNSCDEMASVRLQVQRLHELERYVDAQAGGPGEGWLRIVRDPFEARAVMNAGKVAVVPGIELSEPFGCRAPLGIPQCTVADIDRQIEDLQALGIRQMILIHKLDNALGGVSGDGGPTGVLINVGNIYATGHPIDMETCDPAHTEGHDNPQVLTTAPAEPHCNRLGLTALGAHAVEAMMARDVIIDVDHMGTRARDAALDIMEAAAYPGVVSSHGWLPEESEPRVLRLGGVASPYAGGSEGFATSWARLRSIAPEGYVFGLGYGADANGLGTQGDPRRGPNPVTYPFTGFGGTTIERQRSGSRVYDVNRDGVAHYGLYPDWIEDLRHLAGDAIVDDLARGPEAYLQMWERTLGIRRAAACPAPVALRDVRRGMTVEQVLRAAGQPTRRAGRTFTYCDRTVVFDDHERVARTAE